MASLTITIVVSADPSENVHSKVKASGAELWEIAPMLERAIADLQQELVALPPSHRERAIGWPVTEHRRHDDPQGSNC